MGSSERASAPDCAELLACLRAPAGAKIDGLQRLSGGANMETWALDLVRDDDRRPLILRRKPSGVAGGVEAESGNAAEEGAGSGSFEALSLATEATLIELARRAGVPVPAVLARSPATAPLGEALVMNRIAGEALPRRLLRDETFARARQRLPFQCGEALGRLHSVALEDCPAGLRDLSWAADLARLQDLCDHFGNPSPAHQLALNWLKEQPGPEAGRVLCHGDFRLGNLLVGEDGLNAVLDWELAHIGYPGEDLGYLCANVWRFGGAAPVAGLGRYRQLLDGYRSVRDEAPDLQELKLWELYAALGWGLVCLRMLEIYDSGVDPSLERAAVGRRLSESEIDILLLLDELAP